MPDPSAPVAVEHIFPVRVYYEDTDAAGIVYYANYLRYAERARTEMMRDFGLDHVTLLEREGLTFAVRHCEADYLRPAQLDDLLEVVTSSLGATGASIWLAQIVRRADTSPDEKTLVEMKVQLVCRRRDGRPTRLPGRIRETFVAVTH